MWPTSIESIVAGADIGNSPGRGEELYFEDDEGGVLADMFGDEPPDFVFAGDATGVPSLAVVCDS